MGTKFRSFPADMFEVSESWSHVCRVKITLVLRLMNRLVYTRTNSMNYLVNWILLRICARSRNTLPHVKETTR